MLSAGVKVLLTEDDPMVANLISTLLGKTRPESLRLDWFSDLKSCLDALTHKKYDVLLLDLFLPDSHGLNTIRAVRKHDNAIPIVAMTGVMDDSLPQDALKAGAQEFFEKSELNDKLLKRVMQYAMDRKAFELERERHADELEARVAKRTQELQSVKDQWERTFDAVPDLVTMVDKDYKIVRANAAMACAAGLSTEELLGRYCYVVMHDSDSPLQGCPLSKSLEDAQSHIHETYEPSLNLHLLISCTPLHDENGHPCGGVNVGRDISQFKQAQLALVESELRHRMFMDRLPDPIVVYDGRGKATYINAAFELVFGWTLDELNNNKNEFVPRESLQKNIDSLKRMMRGEPAVEFETAMFSKGGRKLAVLVNSAPLFDSDDIQTGNIVILRDITSMKEAEAAKIASEQKFGDLVETMNEGLLTVDSRSRITYANPRFCQLLGFSLESIKGKHFSALLDEHSQRVFAEQWKKRQKGVVETYGVTLNKKDGGQVFTIVSPQGVYDDHGKLVGAFAVVTDITEQKKLEAQLLQSQKLESIGQLAAGIAHEINTPTQYVGDNTRFLKEAFSDINHVLDRYGQLKHAAASGLATAELMAELDKELEELDVEYLREEIPQAINQSLEGVERVASIVRAMKDFSHPGTDDKTFLDVNKAIESTVTVARNEWKYVADLELDLDASLPLIPVLPGEFNQVILNMIINSSHAIADEIGGGGSSKGLIEISTRLKGDKVEIRISDTGCGIPKEIQDRVFDPFFTTKEVGKGTGQGLAIARSVIVGKHAGSLQLETGIACGATFKIELPIHDDERGGVN